MKTFSVIATVIVGVACFVSGDRVDAATTAGIIGRSGDQRPVARVDPAATFDAISSPDLNVPLSDYREGGLYVNTNGDSWVVNPDFSNVVLDPFGGANVGPPSPRGFYAIEGGAPSTSYNTDSSWTVIHTDNTINPMLKITAVDFMYGNSWSNGNIYGNPWGNSTAWVEWRTFNGEGTSVGVNLTEVSHGFLGPPNNYQYLQIGDIVDFHDSVGFDQLWVRCQAPNQADPNLQAIALDNLHVQLLTAPVPEPSTLILLAAALIFLGVFRRRIRT